MRGFSRELMGRSGRGRRSVCASSPFSFLPSLLSFPFFLPLSLSPISLTLSRSERSELLLPSPPSPKLVQSWRAGPTTSLLHLFFLSTPPSRTRASSLERKSFLSTTPSLSISSNTSSTSAIRGPCPSSPSRTSRASTSSLPNSSRSLRRRVNAEVTSRSRSSLLSSLVE